MSVIHDRSRSLLFSASLAVTLLAAPADAAVVTRGPYLQMGSATTLVVRWRTDQATDSRVRYGLSPTTLTSSASNVTVTTEHQVALTNLTPATLYYYSVGSTTQALVGDDANHFFKTAPAAGTATPTRIWVLGDSGTANSSARAVRDAYQAFTGSRHTDLWLMLGDNAYQDGTDAEYQAAVFNTYPQMLRKSVLWPTLGNHDGHTADSGTQTGPYYDIFTLPKNAEAGGLASGTEAYYSFDWGNVHFVVLDSFDSSRSPTGAMLTWLRADLDATDKEWLIAFWHHPPYTKGSHDSDSESGLRDMRQNALPILEDAGVDLVLTGHSHSYERSFLLDGHYGASTTLQPSMILDGGDGRPTGSGSYQKPTGGLAGHEGAVYTVAGSSGQVGGGSLDHPAMFLSLNVLGSLVLDIDGRRLDATFLDSTGAVRDTFTLRKGSAGGGPQISATPATTTPAANVTVSVANGPANTRDWAGLFSTSGNDLQVLAWKYLNGLTTPPVTGIPSATLTFTMPAGAGAYDFRLFSDDSYTKLATSAVVTTQGGATLSASPASVSTLGTVNVALSGGPGHARDWVGLFTAAAGDTQVLAWKYLNGLTTPPASGTASAALSFSMPATGGVYEFRLFADDTYTKIATSNGVAVQGGATLTANPAQTSGGGTVTVSVGGGPGEPGDWVGLHTASAGDMQILDWKYMNGLRTPPAGGTSTAALTFVMPATAGTYNFRFFRDNSYQRLAVSTDVSVQVVTPTVTLAPNSVLPGAALAAAVSNGPGNARDWLGLFATGGSDMQVLDWKYLNGARTPPAQGATTANVSFAAPQAPGTYEVRLFRDDGYSRLAASPPITVQ